MTTTWKRSTYRGYSITTQWADVQVSGQRPRKFDAGFDVCPIGPEGESWQVFPKTIFATPEAAEANALGAARRSIDDIADAPPAH